LGRSIVEPTELAKRLEERFGKNEPIFISDVMEIWNEYSGSSVYKLIKVLCDEGTLTKATPGVYYFAKYNFSKDGFRGGKVILRTTKIAERKYLKYKGKVFGYYSGLYLMNYAGFSNQVPNTYEIVTMNETTSVRTVMINGFNFILRRARIDINEKNAPVMQILEIFNQYDKPLAEYQKENLMALAGGKIEKNILWECAKCFPRRALENMKRSGLYEVLT
jgi:hypothetical protein